MNLTASQQKVIDFPYRPASTLRIIAGPGTGKTFTLLHKVHHLVRTGQVRPHEILILSVTHKAVDSIVCKLVEVFERHNENNKGKHAGHDIRDIVSQIHVNTVHGLANRIVVENEGLVSIIEENGWRGLMKLLSQDPWKTPNSQPMTSKEAQKIFTEYKRGHSRKNQIMERLLETMKECRVLTNEDLISNASHYLAHRMVGHDFLKDPSITQDLIDRFKVVVIDEFQDLFPSLLPLLENIAANKQLLLFGDPNQSIYNFLGDNKIVIDRLDKLHKSDDFATVYLYDNFRNTPEIMSAAFRVISHESNLDKEAIKEIVSKDHSGIFPEVQETDDPIKGLDFIVEQICMLVCSGAFLSDVAILTRTNAQLHGVADHLSFYGIPFQKLTSQPAWLSDVRVQFLIGLLRTAMLIRKGTLAQSDPSVSKRSDFGVIVALSSIRGIGDQAVQSLFKISNEKNISLWNYITEFPRNEWPSTITNKKKIERYIAMVLRLIRYNCIVDIDDPLKLLASITDAACTLDFAPMVIKEEHELSEYKSNLKELFKVMKTCALNKPPVLSLADWFLESYVERGLMQKHQDGQVRWKGLGLVNISTIHSSKGSEFPIVFLTGGPIVFTGDRKLLYVGMTRARNLLYLNNIKQTTGITSNVKAKKHIPLLLNNKFWGYYNQDLKRPDLHSDSESAKAYEKMRKKFGFNSINKRTITTWNYRNVFSLFKCAIR